MKTEETNADDFKTNWSYTYYSRVCVYLLVNILNIWLWNILMLMTKLQLVLWNEIEINICCETNYEHRYHDSRLYNETSFVHGQQQSAESEIVYTLTVDDINILYLIMLLFINVCRPVFLLYVT